MFKKLLFSTVLFGQIVSFAYGSARTTMNFNDAWNEGKFSGSNLKSVLTLESNDDSKKLNENQKNFFADSTSLTNVRILNLKDQKLTDDFMKGLCNNPTFSRLIRIDLSQNPDLTDKTLEYISESINIGSVRDLPQISSRFGVSSSEIILDVSGTGISLDAIKKYNNNPQNKNFLIEYIHPEFNKQIAPISMGIKWLVIEKDGKKPH